MAKTKNIQLRQIKEKSFKKYRNKIVDLTKINRKLHYQEFSEENKRNSKAIWQGIHNIIYSKKGNRINTPSSLLLEGNIAPTKKHFSDYLKAPNTDILYISPTTPKEISDLIKTLKNSKSLGPNSIPTNILKEIHETISIPLSTLINKSFTTGVFPNMCKMTKVVQIFKSETRLLCNNYRPISLISNIGKIIEKLIHLITQSFLRNTQLLLSVQIWF